MRFKTSGDQGGLFDYQERKAELSQRSPPLDRLNERVDWEVFRDVLEKQLNYKHEGRVGGRTPWDPVLMFKIILLQKYFDLSEEQTEFQILDRFSFQRFLGMDVSDEVPEKNTIWNDKERLGKQGMQECFECFDKELREAGLLASKGKIVDASFVDVPKQRNSRKENQQIKEGKMPEDWEEKPSKKAQKEVDARWASKNKEQHFGYKNHVKCNANSKLIEKYSVSDASVHDSREIEGLIDEEKDGRLHADSAYRSQEMDRYLQEKGIQNRIYEKGYRGSPLSEKQKENNRKKSKTRARVEHIFGFQAQRGGDWIRTIGKRRAEFNIGLGNMVYNLFRYMQLGKSMT